jgi:predicted nucleotidyltransferase
MRREEASAPLRAHLPTIRRAFGIRRIALFGSTAHGDARDDRDLDLLVEFVQPAGDRVHALVRRVRPAGCVTPPDMRGCARPAPSTWVNVRFSRT